MKKRLTIGHSLTKTLTIKLAALLIGVLVVIAVGSYHLVLRIVKEETFSYNTTLADCFLDSLVRSASEDGRPIDGYYSDTIAELGEAMCRKNYAAFIETVSVCPDKKHVRILGISGVPSFEEMISPELIGTEAEHDPSPEELELWNLERTSLSYDDFIVKRVAVSSCAREDGFGNVIVATVGVSYDQIVTSSINDYKMLLLTIVTAFLVLTMCIYLIIRASVLVPATRISDFMAAFIKDGKRSHEKLDESGSDEFALIAASFNRMNDDIDQYLENIRLLSSATERQNTELDIASKIQQGFLAPTEYFAQNCEIHAMMTPARNVGGDLYDYMTLDDGRVLIIIADVSGKGIAASMYMAILLVVMHQTASTGAGPAEILKETNDIFSRRNKDNYFATAFVGIYDPQSREFTYAGAGHLPPYLLSDTSEPLTVENNLVLGLYEGETYEENTIRLAYGDTVFLYTDGVTEAVDGSRRFFGDERLKKVLDDYRASHEENVVDYVRRALADFTDGTERFDDVTMLSVTVKHRTELELAPDRSEFSRIKQLILDSELPRSLQLNLCVAAEEIFINICSYAFEGRLSDTKNTIRFLFEHSDRIFMRFEDNGIAYDPTAEVGYDVDYDPDEQLGGLGKIIAFTIADKVSYEYIDSKNVLTITKYLREV